MANKTNVGLVEYAKAQLGLPYWYGTFGQTGTVSLLNAKAKQYPRYYGSSRVNYARAHHIGKRVHDCVGLIKGYLWSETPTSTPIYNSAQDVSANGMLSKCKEKGTIGSMPDVVGVLVFMDGHTGVYIGNGEVIEARGFDYGVVKTKLSERPWKNWGKCPYISYVSTVSQPSKPQQPSGSGKYNVGDVVRFNGTKHYKSASALIGSKCKGGKAKVTAYAKGTKHPYHLINVSGGGSTVYGWVNESDISSIGGIGVGSKVKIRNGAVYGGLSTSRGRKIPSTYINKTYTVSKIATHRGVQEALIKELVSWVSVGSLILV